MNIVIVKAPKFLQGFLRKIFHLQLSTLQSIAKYLGVNLSDLFSSSPTISLHSIIVHDNTTYIADDLNCLINNVKAICSKEGVEL